VQLKGNIFIANEYIPDPADRIITATAMTMGLPLVTSDNKIIDYPHVQTIWEEK